MAALGAVALGGLAGLAACNGSEARGPSKDVDASTPLSASGTTGTSGSDTPVASGTGTDAGGPAECMNDGDCRTFASYCADAPCACKALPKTAADPTCSGQKVACLANPCTSKAGACQSGHCELVMAKTN